MLSNEKTRIAPMMVSPETAPLNPEPRKSLGKQVFEVVKETADRSSIHGFPSFASPTVHWIIKLIWLVAVGASWGYLIFQINNSFNLYNSYSVVSSTSVVYEAPTDFFAVDICSLNPLRPTWNYSSFSQILTDYQLSTDFNSIMSFVGKMETLFQVFFQFFKKFGNFDVYYAGIPLADMLVSCEFQGKKCTVADFYWYADFNYGNCYRFNGGAQAKSQIYGPGLKYTNRATMKTYQPGLRYGLRLELYSPIALANSPYTYKNGFKITVHNQSTLIDADDDGFDVQVGVETNVAVSRTLINRLSKPYSNCIDELTSERASENRVLTVMKGKIDSGEIQAYQQSFCLKTCFQYFMLARCNCSLANYIYLNVANLTTICYNSKQVACSLEATDYFHESNAMNECVASCPVACTTTKYEAKVTTANYPTEWYANYVNQNQAVFNLTSVFNTTNITYDLIRSSTAFVSIYYDSMEYTSIQESPTFTFDLLLANIGGNLGLFTGMSILSFVEFVEAFVGAILVIIFFQMKKSSQR